MNGWLLFKSPYSSILAQALQSTALLYSFSSFGISAQFSRLDMSLNLDWPLSLFRNFVRPLLRIIYFFEDI